MSLRAIATAILIGLQGCGGPAAIERPPPPSAAGPRVDADPRAARSPADAAGCSCDRIAAPIEVPTGVARGRWDQARLGVASLLRELDRVIRDRGCDATTEITAVLDGRTSIEREWRELGAEGCGHFARWLEAGADILPLSITVVGPPETQGVEHEARQPPARLFAKAARTDRIDDRLLQRSRAVITSTSSDA